MHRTALGRKVENRTVPFSYTCNNRKERVSVCIYAESRSLHSELKDMIKDEAEKI